MWFGLARMALKQGAKSIQINKKQKWLCLMQQLMHAERMARGEETYQGKLLESRDNDYKDEIVLGIISAPIIVLAWGVVSDDPGNDGEDRTSSFIILARICQNGLQTFWITCSSQRFWYKGNTSVPKRS